MITPTQSYINPNFASSSNLAAIDPAAQLAVRDVINLGRAVRPRNTDKQYSTRQRTLRKWALGPKSDDRVSEVFSTVNSNADNLICVQENSSPPNTTLLFLWDFVLLKRNAKLDKTRARHADPWMLHMRKMNTIATGGRETRLFWTKKT